MVTVYIATSLDGYIATREHGLDWLGIVRREGEDYGYAEFMGSVDALVMGRNTYDVVRGFGGEWPFKGKKVVVFTHRPFEPVADETRATAGLRETLSSLRSEGARHVYLDGGQMVRTGLAEGLVDRLIVSVIPVLLGDGISLFQGLGTRVGLECLNARRFDSGLVQLSYRVTR